MTDKNQSLDRAQVLDIGKKRNLSREEAAAFLGISPLTLQSWSSRKKFDPPFLKIGRSVRYRLQDLIDYETRQTQATHTAITQDQEAKAA